MKTTSPNNPIRNALKHLALAAMLGASFLAGSAQAATLTWNPGGGGNWDTTTANWTGDATTFISDGTQDVIFDKTAGGTITISAGMQPASTTVSATSGTYIFNTGPITGSGGLTKSGAGQLTMNTANNTYTGKTSIQGGTLLTGGAAYLSNAGSPGVFGAPAAGANATIDLHNGVTLQNNGSSPRVNQSTDRLLNLAGAGPGTVSVRYNDNDASLRFGGVTATGTGAKLLRIDTGINGNGDREAIIFTGGIADSSDGSPTSVTVTFNTQGYPNWVSLNGVNTFTGPITLSQINGTANGVLVVGGFRAAQSGANTIGTGSLGSGNYPGTISLGARTVLEYDSTTAQTLAGAISGAGALQLTGSGPVTLSATNTYRGNTTVNSGCSLVLDSAGSLGFRVTDTTANKLTGAGSATLNGAFTIDTTGTTAFVGSWTLVDVTTKTYGGSFGVAEFTGPVGTVFTKEDGVKTWTFDTATGVLSVTAKALITSFGTPGHTGVIDQVAKTIALDVSYGTDLATLAPTFVTSSGTCDQTSGSPPSPTFASANPATYTVTDVSASVTNSYTVTVAVAPVPPGGVGGGLNAWYDASVGVTTSGSNVTAWKDQSGNGYHATPGTGTPQLGTSQINGLPAVLFRGNNLNINHNIVPRQEYIVFKSGRYSYNPGDPNKWGSDWGGPFGQQNDNGWMLEANTRKMWSDGSRVPLAVSQNGTAVVQNNAEGNPYGMTNVANYMILKVNPRNYGSAYGRIGRPNNSWGNGQVDVAEIIVYDRLLSSEEENAVGYYLSTKYGVSSTYVNPNPTAPENLQAIAGDAQVSLTWTTYIGATSYNVKRSLSPGGPYTTVGTSTETSYTDSSSVVNDTPYYYVVSAVAGSESPNSTEVSATPTGVNATLSTVVTSLPVQRANGVDSVTITVTLRNSSNTPIAGKVVTLGGTGSPVITTVTGTTGADGKAVFTATSTTVGTAVFTATDTTDGNLVIAQTAEVDFIDPNTPQSINVNFTGGTAETESTLSGPGGGLGTTWNQFMGPDSPGTMVDSIGAGTNVTIDTNFGLPGTLDSPVIALPMLRGSMTNFDKGNDGTNVTINGLEAGGFYNIWMVTLRNQPFGSDGTEQYVGWWSTTNATTSPSNQLVNAVGATVNTSTFVAGYNYVLFENVEANGGGQIVFTGKAGDQLDGSDNNHRLGLNGLQIEKTDPPPLSSYAGWSGGAPANGDENNDGVQNAVAWVLGAADPDENAVGLLPTLDNTSDPDFFIFNYRRSDTANGDETTAIKVEYSSDLAVWNNAVAGPDIVITPLNDDYALGIDRVEVKIRRTLAVGGKLFARLNVVVTTP